MACANGGGCGNWRLGANRTGNLFLAQLTRTPDETRITLSDVALSVYAEKVANTNGMALTLVEELSDILESTITLLASVRASREDLNLVRASIALSVFQLRETTTAARALTAELSIIDLVIPQVVDIDVDGGDHGADGDG